MLKIKEIGKSEIPKEVWAKFHGKDWENEIKEVYLSEGMFGSLPDYLLVLNSEGERYYGYVYNGNEPAFSEFGSFGINTSKTERVW